MGELLSASCTACGYRRSFDISGIEESGVKAEYTDGVLKLTMPKKSQTVSGARRLAIE